MDRAGAVMRRDGAAGQVRRLGRGAAAEEEQGAAAADGIGGQAGIGEHGLEAEDAFVEGAGPVHVVDVERRFEHAGRGRGLGRRLGAWRRILRSRGARGASPAPWCRAARPRYGPHAPSFPPGLGRRRRRPGRGGARARTDRDPAAHERELEAWWARQKEKEQADRFWNGPREQRRALTRDQIERWEYERWRRRYSPYRPYW